MDKFIVSLAVRLLVKHHPFVTLGGRVAVTVNSLNQLDPNSIDFRIISCDEIIRIQLEKSFEYHINILILNNKMNKILLCVFQQKTIFIVSVIGYDIFS